MSKLKSAIVKPGQQKPKRRTKKLHRDLLEQLNEDESSIHRRLPVPRPPFNLDQSTLYIENLPHDTTIEWLKEVCEKIGTVCYISLPRYRKSGKVKGFAFIEFSSPEEVIRACRVLNDPPTQFFPDRAEKYLLRLKRLKMLEQNREELKSETPRSEFKTPETVRSGGSSCLNKSLDSALELDSHIPETPTTTHEGRKRRRSKRLSSQGSETASPGDRLSHTAAKKLKSLPTDSSCQQKSMQPEKTSDENRGGASCLLGINKNKRKVSFDPVDSSASAVSSTVDSAIANDKSTTRTSDDNISEPNTCARKRLRLDSAEKKTQEMQLNEKYSKKDLNGSSIQPSAGISDSKLDISETSKQTLSEDSVDAGRRTEKSLVPLEASSSNGVITSTVPSSSTATSSGPNQAHKGTITEAAFRTSKRKRSISEPPCGYESSTPKLRKIQETDFGATGREDAGSGANTGTDVIGSFDIDAIIAQGRQQAQALKKPRQRGRKKKEKPIIPETPPKLSVMPKVEWLKYKQEYRRLQKENMSRLKRILRAGKNAGSVFIKKHLDVLKDGNVTDDSLSSDSDNNNDSAIQPVAEVKKEKPEKRGPPTFTPGVIAKVSASGATATNEKPMLPNIEEIKSILSKYGRGVAYVDTKPGEASGFVRFYDGDSAQRAIMEEKTLALCLLTGELEERYWDKLLASRAQKFARERPKISGRTKILIRADRCIEKAKRRHIRFDNDFTI